MQEIIDGLMVLVLFALRIALPIALTLALGAWLERKLQPERREAPTRNRIRFSRPDHPFKAARLHCWDVAHCEAAQRAHCAAFAHPELPCWLAMQVEGNKVRQECFTCDLYSPQKIAA